MADKLRKASSTGVATVATVADSRAIGETTLSVNTGGLTNWATTTDVDFSTYTLTTDPITNVSTITNKCEWTGRADLDNDLITGLELTSGTDAGNSADDIIVCLETSAWVNDLIDTLLSVFDSTGALRSNSINGTAIVNSAISTIKMADSTVTPQKINWSSFSNNIKSAMNSGPLYPTNSDQDLASGGLSLSFTVSSPCTASVTVSMGVASSSDFEFRPEIRLGGSVVATLSPVAASSYSGRATVRGFTYKVDLASGANTISAGVWLINSTGALIVAGGATISAIVLGDVTA